MACFSLISTPASERPRPRLSNKADMGRSGCAGSSSDSALNPILLESRPMLSGALDHNGEDEAENTGQYHCGWHVDQRSTGHKAKRTERHKEVLEIKLRLSSRRFNGLRFPHSVRISE